MHLEFIRSYREYLINGKHVTILGEIHLDEYETCNKHNDHVDIVNFLRPRLANNVTQAKSTILLLEYNANESKPDRTLSKNLKQLAKLEHIGYDRRVLGCVNKLYNPNILHFDENFIRETIIYCMKHLVYLIEEQSNKHSDESYLNNFLKERCKNFELMSHLMSRDTAKVLEILKHEYAYMSDFYIIERILNPKDHNNYVILIGSVHAEHLYGIFKGQCVYEVVGKKCVKV
jgi:hypothetical protein